MAVRQEPLTGALLVEHCRGRVPVYEGDVVGLDVRVARELPVAGEIELLQTGEVDAGSALAEQ